MGILSIKHDNAHQFRLYLNQVDCFLIIPYSVRLDLWKKANKVLEDDVTSTAEYFKNEPFGEYIWCLNYENHRNVGLLLTIYYYYLFLLIDWLVINNDVKSIKVETVLPYGMEILLKRTYPIIVGFQATNKFNQFVKFKLKPWLSAYKKIFSLINFNFFKSNNQQFPNESFLIQVKDDFKKNRYSTVLENIDQNKIIVFHKDIWRNPQEHPFGKRSLDFSKYINFSIVYQAYRNTIDIEKLKSKKKDFMAKNLFTLTVNDEIFSQLFLVQLKKIVFEKAIKQINPKALFTVTSITDPVSRLPETITAKFNIPTVVVACRSMISSLRAEDRAAFPDIHNYNNTAMGSFFIVRDSYSKNTWISQGIQKEKIFIIPTNKSIIKSSEKTEINNGIILLLTQAKNNTCVFEFIAEAGLSNYKKIYLRSHPNRRKINEVTLEQKEILLNAGFELEDITDIPMNNIISNNTIAITSNSTAGVEIVKTGAGIIWAPFVSEHSIQFGDVMECLGKPCYDKETFIDFMKKIDNDKIAFEDFIVSCMGQYQDSFEAKEIESMADFFKNKIKI